MAREYLVWNAAIAALQFWTADLKAHALSSTIEEVYVAFFYATSADTLHQQSDEVLFSHFMTTLNAAFEQKLALEDEGYESGSENFNIPTPLRRTFKIHHMSSVENASFYPTPATPHSTKESHLRPLCRQLTYSSSDDVDTPEDEAPSPCISSQVQYHRPNPQAPASKHTLSAHVYLEEDEDFQTVPLDDEHWTTQEIPDRPLCIHKHSLPHRLCPYPCPYANYQTPSYFKTMELTFLTLKIS